MVIRNALVDEFGVPDSFTYLHESAADEPMLWASDVFAWAWGQGGRYRGMLEQVDLKVIQVQMP